MPFTVTHIAAAFPLAWLMRWRLPLSALAIGCMIPDIAVFYPVLLDYNATHSAIGILTHCMPSGVAVYYLYQMLLKQPLADLLPRSAAERLWPHLSKPLDLSLSAIIIVMICVALGASTHVFWDGFTHVGRWGATMFPWLNSTAFFYGDISIAWYSVFQHASSLVFLPAMLVGFLVWIRQQQPDRGYDEHAQFPRAVSWIVIALMAVGMLLHIAVVRESMPQATIVRVARHVVKVDGAIVMLILLVYCIAMHVRWATRRDNR